MRRRILAIGQSGGQPRRKGRQRISIFRGRLRWVLEERCRNSCVGPTTPGQSPHRKEPSQHVPVA